MKTTLKNKDSEKVSSRKGTAQSGTVNINLISQPYKNYFEIGSKESLNAAFKG